MSRTRGKRALRAGAASAAGGLTIIALAIGGAAALADAAPDPASDAPSHAAVMAPRVPAADAAVRAPEAVSGDVAAEAAPPEVVAVAVGADEGGVGTVRATVPDSAGGPLSARIEWGDATPAEPVTLEELAVGVQHEYRDDGDYPVVVTITDADGRAGAHAVAMRIVNLAPEVDVAFAGATAFPGGEYAVVGAGSAATATARATDAGSDDLVFVWSHGLGRTFLHDGANPDAPLSASGRTPVAAETVTHLRSAQLGVRTLRVTVEDDDGGRADAAARVLVTGTDAGTRSRSRWIQDLSGGGAAAIPAVTAAGYLDVVEAASAVFSETAPVATAADAVAVLSPREDDPRAQARAELLCAWLQFASGAVSWESEATTAGGQDVAFAELVTDAEAAIASPATTDAELRRVVADLSRVSSPGE